MSYKKIRVGKSSIRMNNTREGHMIEQVLERRLANKEPIEGESQLIYTEKADGVLAGYNIRTDRFEVAIDGMGAIDKSYKAKRENNTKLEIVKEEKEEKEIKAPKENGKGEVG